MIVKSLLLVLEVLTSILLIGIILMQKSKGGGLGGSAFGGGSGESFFGARAGNVLTKITIGLSVFFLSNTLILAFLYAESDEKSLMEKAGRNGNALEPIQSSDVPPVPSGPVDGVVGDGLGEELITVDQPMAQSPEFDPSEDILFLSEEAPSVPQDIENIPSDASGVSENVPNVSADIPDTP